MTVEQRATQIWPVLVWAATHRQTITYYQLSRLTGHATQGIGQCLEPIDAYCRSNNLPPLTAIAVNQETGMPGQHFIGAARDVGLAQSKVYAFDWQEISCPTQGQLKGAKYLSSEGKATDNSE